MKTYFQLVFIILFANKLYAQSFEQKQQLWADSVFNALDTNQRLGQLFIIEANSKSNEKHYGKIDTLVKFNGIGGIIFLQRGSARNQAVLTNRYQSQAKTPLLVCIDAEWGLQMRLDSTMYFPRQMVLGALSDNSYIYRMGKSIAKHCKRMGIHVNFAPVVDVNVNPDNPVIGMRSFGENKVKVAEKGIAYMKGMQHNGIMANAKHFPGHGDTDADSHFALPVINHDKKRLDDIELYPFKRLIKDSLMSVMVAHIHIPTYDSRLNIATTLSQAVVNDLLKTKMGFKGLVFTDAMNMKGVSKFYEPGESDVMALIAGNDVLLVAQDVPVAIQKIKEALIDGKLKQADLDISIKKILKAKYWAGLHHYQPIDTTNLYQDLNPTEDQALRQEMYEKAVTILKNEKGIIPYKELSINTFASLTIGLKGERDFNEMLDNYVLFSHFSIAAKDSNHASFNKLLDTLSKFTRVIVSLNGLNNKKKENYGISTVAVEFVRKLQSRTNVVLVHLGNVYALKQLEFANTLVCGYEDNEVTRKVIPEILFGAVRAEGKLAVTVTPTFKAGYGIQTQSLSRLIYGFPETVSIPTANFSPVDSIMNEALKDGSTPGAQLMVIKDGVVIYRKNFGYHTYDRTIPVTNGSVYDIASVTKTAATMQAIMFLNGWKKFDPDKFASDYLPELKGTNKENLIIRDILVHQAGLAATLDHWRKTIKDGKPDEKFYKPSKNGKYTRQVATNLYTTAELEDSVWQWTINSKLTDFKSDTGCYPYKYSDLAFYFMKQITEKQLNQPMEEFLKQNFYKPLGLSTMTYRPCDFMPYQKIVPTEEDKNFRMGCVQGMVHDQGAAITNGVAGHAGIFSNANDLAILGQMHIAGGIYGGMKYLEPETIEEFTRSQYFNNRRALGWDRPFPPEEIVLASQSTFGHTGFTGTAWWIDPEQKVVFVFLSNRTYPFADNKRLTSNSVRTKLLNAVYQGILK
jgi:beta-N-acetylhexosaminidase